MTALTTEDDELAALRLPLPNAAAAASVTAPVRFMRTWRMFAQQAREVQERRRAKERRNGNGARIASDGSGLSAHVLMGS